MTVTRFVTTCRLCVVLFTAVAISAAAGEPGQPPNAPNPLFPLPVIDADQGRTPMDKALTPYEQESGTVGTAACPPCSPRGGPLRNFWFNRLKPHLQYTHWGYAPYFEELPLGSRLYDHMSRQIHNGARDQMVLYRYDFGDQWEAGAERLNEYGVRHLEDLMRWLQSGLSPLVVESTPSAPELDEARRRHVVERLVDAGIPMPDDLVVVGRPAARGLGAEEALLIYEKQLQQTRQGGTSFAGGGGSRISAAPSGASESQQ